jgi:hypothetical protein
MAVTRATDRRGSFESASKALKYRSRAGTAAVIVDWTLLQGRQTRTFAMSAGGARWRE